METIKASELVHRVVDKTYEELVTLQRELPQEVAAVRQQKLYKFLTVLHVRLAKTLAVIRAAAPGGPHAEIAVKVAAARRLEFAAQQMQEFSAALRTQIPLTPQAPLPSQDAQLAVSLVARAPVWAAITHPKRGPSAARKMLRPVPFSGLPPKLYSYASLAQLPGSWLNVAWRTPPPDFSSKLLLAVMPHLTVPTGTTIQPHPTQSSRAVFSRHGHYSVEMQPVLLGSSSEGGAAGQLAVGWQVREIRLAGGAAGDYALTNLQAVHTQRVAIVLSVLSQRVPASQQLAAMDAFLRRLLAALALDSAAAAAVQMTQAAAAAGRLHASSSSTRSAASSQALLPTHRRMALHFAAAAMSAPARLASLAETLTGDGSDKAGATMAFLQGAMSSSGGQHAHELALSSLATRVLFLRSANTVLFALDGSPIRHAEEASPLPPPLSSPAAGHGAGRRHGRSLVSDLHATLAQANAEGVSPQTRANMLCSVMETLAAGALCLDALRVAPVRGGGSTLASGPPSATPLTDAAVAAAPGTLPPSYMACSISNAQPGVVQWLLWVPTPPVPRAPPSTPCGPVCPVEMSFPLASAPSVAHMAGLAIAMNTLTARNMLEAAAARSGQLSRHCWQVGWQLPTHLSAPAPAAPPVLPPALAELTAQMKAVGSAGDAGGNGIPGRSVQLQLPYALLPPPSLRSVKQWLPQLHLLPSQHAPQDEPQLRQAAHAWLVDLAQHAHSALLGALARWAGWSRGQLLTAFRLRWHAQLLAAEDAQHFGQLLPASPWGQLDTRDSPLFSGMVGQGGAGGGAASDPSADLLSVLPADMEPGDEAVQQSVQAAVRVRALVQQHLCVSRSLPPRHTALPRLVLLAARAGVAAASEGLAWMKHLQSGAPLPSTVPSERFGAQAAQAAAAELVSAPASASAATRLHSATQLGRAMSTADRVFLAAFSHYSAAVLGAVLWRLAAAEAAKRSMAVALGAATALAQAGPGRAIPVQIHVGHTTGPLHAVVSCALSPLPGLDGGAALRLDTQPSPAAAHPFQLGSSGTALAVKQLPVWGWSAASDPLREFGLVDLGGHWHQGQQAEERPPPDTLALLLQGPIPETQPTPQSSAEQASAVEGAEAPQTAEADVAAPAAAAAKDSTTPATPAAKDSTDTAAHPYSQEQPEQNTLVRSFWRGIASAGSWQSLSPCLDVAGVGLQGGAGGGLQTPGVSEVSVSAPSNAEKDTTNPQQPLLLAGLVPSLAAAVSAASAPRAPAVDGVNRTAGKAASASGDGQLSADIPVSSDSGKGEPVSGDGRTPALCVQASPASAGRVARAVARMAAQQCTKTQATQAITTALQPDVAAICGALRTAQAAVAGERPVCPATQSPRVSAAVAAMQPHVLLSVQLPADLLLASTALPQGAAVLGSVRCPPALRLDVLRVVAEAAADAGATAVFLGVQGGSPAAIAALNAAMSAAPSQGVRVFDAMAWLHGSAPPPQAPRAPVYMAPPHMLEYVTGSISAAAEQTAAILAFVPRWAAVEELRERHGLYAAWTKTSTTIQQRLMQVWAKKNPRVSPASLPPLPESLAKMIPVQPEGALETPPDPPRLPAAWSEASLPAQRPAHIGLLDHNKQQQTSILHENVTVCCIHSRSVVPSAAAAVLVVPRVLLPPVTGVVAPSLLSVPSLQLRQAPLTVLELQSQGSAARQDTREDQAARVSELLHAAAWVAVLQGALAMCGWEAEQTKQGTLRVRGAARASRSDVWAGMCVPRHLAGAHQQLPQLRYVDAEVRITASEHGCFQAQLQGTASCVALDTANVPGCVAALVEVITQGET